MKGIMGGGDYTSPTCILTLLLAPWATSDSSQQQHATSLNSNGVYISCMSLFEVSRARSLGSCPG